MEFQFVGQDGLTRLAQLCSIEVWATRPIGFTPPTNPLSMLPNYGSGFVYQSNNRSWLVTAAHVIEDMSHGNQTLITGSIDRQVITLVEKSKNGIGRGGSGINVLDGRSSIYFSHRGRLIDLFATELVKNEIPEYLHVINDSPMLFSDMNIKSSLKNLQDAHSGILNGSPISISESFAILGHANGIDEARPPIAVPAFSIKERVFPNIGSHSMALLMQGEPGVSGGPVLRILNSSSVELAGVYTHQLTLSEFGSVIPTSIVTLAWCLKAGCTTERQPGLQIFNLPDEQS